MTEDGIEDLLESLRKLKSKKSRSVLDRLRDAVPGTWTYAGPAGWSRLEGGNARLCGTIGYDGDLGGPLQLYYYPRVGSPLLID